MKLKLLAVPLLFLFGCVSPDTKSTAIVDLDDDSMDGGISSRDIRTIASKMTPEILAVPEVADGEAPVRIKMADIKNSTRFFFDRNIVAKKLRQELNKYAAGQVRFLDNNQTSQVAREQVLKDRQEKVVEQNIKDLGREIAASPVFANATSPVKIAVIPVLNSNIVNMNADSFSAMLRSEVINASGGRIQFLMPGATEGADYWLTGQFYPESLKKEGIINLAEYIDVVDARVRDGKSLYLDSSVTASATPFSATVTATTSKEGILLEMLRSPEMRANPNVNKRLNVMVVNPADKVCVFEKTTVLESRISDKSGNADLILSGEITGISQASGGKNNDYLNFSFQIVDPESNEIVWEGAYEIKRVTKSGIVYR